MTVRKQWPQILLFLFAILAAGYFYWLDRETRLANHLLLSMEATHTGVVEVNAKGIITGVNSEMEALSGFGRKELIGKSLVSIMVSQARTKHPTDFSKTENAFTIVRCEILRKDGTAVPVIITARIGGGLFVATVTRTELVIDHFSK